MSIVIIAEKPSVAEDLANVLGVGKKTETHWHSDDIIITWAIGHLLELKYMDDYDVAFKNWRGTVDRLPFIPDNFQYKPKSGRGKKQLSAILKLVKDKSVSEIVNACDAAREGELIFRTIVQHAKTKTPTSRMWMQSMTYDAMLQAFENRQSGDDYQALSDAAYSRSQADWIIGMNGSRIATRLPQNRDRSANSLGRVQTATLAMVVDHELEVLSHVPVPYWQLNATFRAGDATWTARWERTGHKDDPERPEYKAHRIMDAAEKDSIETILSSDEAFQTEEQQRTRKEQPPLNFDLTTLQKRANSLWSWSAKRTLGVAQDLYDKFKLTTYPRTDSKHLPEDMHETVAKTLDQIGAQGDYSEHVKRLQADGLSNAKRNFNNAKVSDHYAIVPTGQTPPNNFGGDHAKLYDLITRNFLASWHPVAEWTVTKRITTKSGHQFLKEVEALATSGWRAVVPKKDKVPEGWGQLPSNPCDATLDSHEFSEEMSKPKNRLKEASLLQLMEHAGKHIDDDELADAMKEKGLGTPATRADTIEKLLNRNYIRRSRNGTISAAPHGIRMIDVLRRIPVEWITSPELTGDMEASLLAVQRGEETMEAYMEKIIQQTKTMVDRIRDHDRNTLYLEEPSLGSCPSCGGEVKENTLAYQCEHNEGRDKGCSFVFWKDTSGRWFDRVTAARLIENGSLENLHGFYSQAGEGYDTSVELTKTGKVVSKGSGSGEATADDEVLCPCPVCDQGSIRITTTAYLCDNPDCTFRGMQNIMCKRPITPEEAKPIFTDGKSALLEDFTSRRNKPFNAFLKLEKNRVTYDFPPRAAAADAKRFPVVPGVVAVCPKTKANIVETETHYTTEDNSTDCKIHLERCISKRDITREEAKTLIETGSVGPFDDFISKKTNNPFSASLYLKKNQSVGYKFAKRS
ncbi:MAG: DNA topoisomerase [Candidatus Thermoplasmatota archaeon]|nr:DNA topoisomerase [Candidatus Thermoplasmatota archaeon]